MQYAAVWREDGQGIVQIGMEPTRLLRIMSKNELSYIFSLLAGRDGETLYAVDAKTDQIVGSTDKALVGKSLEEIGLKQKKLSGLTAQKPFYVKLGGAWHYGIFADMNDVLVGRVCSVKSLYQEVYKNAGIFFFCFMLVSVLIVLNVFHYLDRKIIRGMTRVNDKVQSIANGNFDETVDVDTTPEFIKLSQNINRMVKRILGNTDKLSSILDQVEMPIGVYEYNLAMKRVQITNKIPEIFGWSNEETKNVVSDYHLFEEHLDKVRKNPVYENKNHIFQVEDGSVRYIKLESYVRDNSFFGILSDVTNEIVEQKKLEEERDQDLLTGLCNRRGYYARLEKLFRKPEELKYAVLIMIDTDNLKKINDTYGHDAGDSYLCGMMQVLKLCTAPQQIQARLSGDEFSLFIYGCSSEEELQQYIEELQQKQGGYDILFQNRLHMSVKFSMGSAFYPMDGDDYVGMLKYADDRMYEDKRRRKEKEKRVQAE